MSDDELPLLCTCGRVRGTAAGARPGSVTRIVCMCDDCQAYAHFLGQANTVLDTHGGTEVFLTTPARVAIQEGLDQVRCTQLAPQGLLRWHTTCCHTPLCNGPRFTGIPFLSVHASFVDARVDRDRALGPIRERIQGRFGIGPLPPDARARASAGLILHCLWQLAHAYGAGQTRPHPFRSTQTGESVVPSTVIAPEERARLRPLCGPLTAPASQVGGEPEMVARQEY